MTNQPSTEATVYRVTNLSNRKLKAFLRKSGACDESIAWIGKRDARTAWLECDDVDWIDWLIGKADGQFGFPTSTQIAPLLAPSYAEWRAKRAPIDAEYEAVIKLLIVFVDETPEQIVRL